MHNIYIYIMPALMIASISKFNCILTGTLVLAFAKAARTHKLLIEVQGWLAYFGMNGGIHVASLPVSLQALDPLLEPLLQKAKFKAGNMIMSLGCNCPFL